MVELYTEAINDLLAPDYLKIGGSHAPKLEVREDKSGMVYINNVSKLQIDSKERAEAIYRKGLNSRKVFSTEMNDSSSRSHLIFSIIVETLDS